MSEFIKCGHCLHDIEVDAGVLLYVNPECPNCKKWVEPTVEDKVNYLLKIQYEKENQQ